MNNQFYRICFIILVFIPLLSSCSQPECVSDGYGYCEIVNHDFESQLNQLALNPLPDNLIQQPIYWSSKNEGNFPKLIDLYYVYIADEYGLWLRYRNTKVDYYLGKTIPKGYFYEEEYIRKSTPEKVHTYGEWIIKLHEKNKNIYQQSIHEVIRLDVAHFSLHSERGHNYYFPQNINEHRKTLSSLQVKPPQYNFPQQTEMTLPQFYHIDVNNPPIWSGNKLCKIRPNTFKWKTKQGEHIVRLNTNELVEETAICGQEINIIIQKHPQSECFDINFINAQQPFSNLDTGPVDFSFRAGYTLKDVVTYRAFAQEFYLAHDLPKSKDDEKSKRIKLINVHLYGKKGEIINDYCLTGSYVPINKITL